MASIFWLAFLVVFGAEAAWVANYYGQQSDKRRYQSWLELKHRQAAEPDSCVITISLVYQRARRGTKAVVRHSDNCRQDAWFEGNWPEPGTVLLVRSNTGWGDHNNNPHVLYVDAYQILAWLPPKTMSAVKRHAKRISAEPARSRSDA